MIQDKNEPETASTPEDSKNAAGITVSDMEKLISILKERILRQHTRLCRSWRGYRMKQGRYMDIPQNSRI